ncbi:PfkB family carbohydrate kinase [Vallicoccus soli]|uniref:PfkB family carbohydrate kinase n=1 Tax=Vallicoccus soli TaxID=2339232 RepID=UPI001C49A383|nr:PfkB family carbohydrate kinase [Vallicoccus soli]
MAERPGVLCVGLATLDVVQRVDRLPGPDEKVVAQGLDVAAGGPAAGAAVTAAALGARAVLVTALGGSPLARLVAEDLRAAGVRLVDAEPGSERLPAVSSATVLTTTGERSVVSVNAEGVAAAPPDGLAGLVAGTGAVLLDGHHPALALAAARAARAAGVPVVLDGGSWKPHLPDLLPLVDVAACSSAFRLPAGEPLTALLGDGARGPRCVAVTRGGGPVGWWARTPGGTRSGEVPVARVRAVDTLGAGDAFHGALAAALAVAPPGPDPVPGLVAALGLAARVASVRVEHAGPRAWLADPRVAGALGSGWRGVGPRP